MSKYIAQNGANLDEIFQKNDANNGAYITTNYIQDDVDLKNTYVRQSTNHMLKAFNTGFTRNVVLPESGEVIATNDLSEYFQPNIINTAGTHCTYEVVHADDGAAIVIRSSGTLQFKYDLINVKFYIQGGGGGGGAANQSCAGGGGGAGTQGYGVFKKEFRRAVIDIGAGGAGGVGGGTSTSGGQGSATKVSLIDENLLGDLNYGNIIAGGGGGGGGGKAAGTAGGSGGGGGGGETSSNSGGGTAVGFEAVGFDSTDSYMNSGGHGQEHNGGNGGGGGGGGPGGGGAPGSGGGGGAGGGGTSVTLTINTNTIGHGPFGIIISNATRINFGGGGGGGSGNSATVAAGSNGGGNGGINGAGSSATGYGAGGGGASNDGGGGGSGSNGVVVIIIKQTDLIRYVG